MSARGDNWPSFSCRALTARSIAFKGLHAGVFLKGMEAWTMQEPTLTAAVSEVPPPFARSSGPGQWSWASEMDRCGQQSAVWRHENSTYRIVKWVNDIHEQVPTIKNKPLRDSLTKKWKFCHHLLTLMLFQNWMSFFLQKKIFWRMLVTKQLTEAINFHNMEINTVGVNGYVNFLVTNILQNIFFCVLQVWNNSRVSKWWQGFNFFWMNCPFNDSKVITLSLHLEYRELTKTKTINQSIVFGINNECFWLKYS